MGRDVGSQLLGGGVWRLKKSKLTRDSLMGLYECISLCYYKSVCLSIAFTTSIDSLSSYSVLDQARHMLPSSGTICKLESRELYLYRNCYARLTCRIPCSSLLTTRPFRSTRSTLPVTTPVFTSESPLLFFLVRTATAGLACSMSRMLAQVTSAVAGVT